MDSVAETYARDMAYGIMGSTRNSFLSTYQTTSRVRCLYFDGSSGALGENGTMDTQMLFLYGNTTGPPSKHSSADFLWDEYARAQHLCGWLQEKGFNLPRQGIEGIVRMSAGFELIWCNFSSPSLRLVSRLNVSVPLLAYNRTSLMGRSGRMVQGMASTDQRKRDENDLPAPDWKIDWEHEPFVASQKWDWFTSTSRTYSSEDLASSREPSLTLLDAHIVSLYSAEYRHQPIESIENEEEHLSSRSDELSYSDGSSLSRRDVMQLLMRRRSRHRVGNMSPQAVSIFRSDVEKMIAHLVNPDAPEVQEAHRSWTYMSDMIVNTFAKRLMQLQHTLYDGYVKPQRSSTSIKQQVAYLRERVHGLVMPFLDYTLSFETSADTFQQQQQCEKIQASLERCKNQYLPSRVSDKYVTGKGKESSSPSFMGQATEEVMDNICTVLISAGMSIERTWLDHFNGKLQEPHGQQQRMIRVAMQILHDDLEELTAWLGWAPHWMGCDRLCAWDVSIPQTLSLLLFL
ncbi:MAG: hypothetical protein L6R41_004687 [Letrouitia leprolyta]|nr:MAG: hypothetical protein L6R41_004687 [Letrouitia leprolyta]